MCICIYGGLVAKLCPTHVTPWTIACQAPLSMGFSRQEYWSGMPFPPPGDLPDPGSNLHLLHWQADSLSLSPLGSPYINTHTYTWASLIAQSVKNRPAMQETWVGFLGWEDPLEKEMATHSSILAWRIPWTAEPGKLQSMGSQESDMILQPNSNRHNICSSPQIPRAF